MKTFALVGYCGNAFAILHVNRFLYLQTVLNCAEKLCNSIRDLAHRRRLQNISANVLFYT